MEREMGMRKQMTIGILAFFVVLTVIPFVITIKNHHALQETYIKNSIDKPLSRLASQMTQLYRQFEELDSSETITEDWIESVTENLLRTNLYFSDFRNNYNDLLGMDNDLAITATTFESDLRHVQVKLEALYDQPLTNSFDENHQQLLEESEEIIFNYYELLHPYEDGKLLREIKRKRDFKKLEAWEGFIKKLSE